MEQELYMRHAIELAKLGTGWVSPNPLVGAVIVKDGCIIGEGWHVRCGELHAERHALSRCTQDSSGAEMYVTLEPCCHHGRQPPCTEAIIAAGIRRVYVGSGDPNPQVAGKGIALLRQAGIEVVENVLKSECDKLNPIFFHYIRQKTPYVVMKYAMTMDGKIAAYTGASKWITGPVARERVQQDRHRYRGIMVGVGTVLADDPLLTCRSEGGRNPVRIICDSNLRTPLDSQIVRTAHEMDTIIATCCGNAERQEPYLKAGCRVWTMPAIEGHPALQALMARLGQEEIDSVLLEGGGTLNWSALEAGIVNRVQTYLAPKLLGGALAKSPVEGRGAPDPDSGIFLKDSKITHLGEDILIESEVAYHVHGNC